MENYGTMEKNYGAMDKTMVLWIKLCYCSENYETSIYEGKKHGRLPKTKKLWFKKEKNYGNIPKIF